MKHKRKILALALALTLCASLVCPVFASSYTVARGDCLWQIAKDLLGSGSRWTEIYEANRDTVKNPSMIQTGQDLVIPDGEAAPQTNPAIPTESDPPNVPENAKEPEQTEDPTVRYQLADANTPVNVDFSCVVSSDGAVVWQAANTTFASLASSLPSGSEYVGVCLPRACTR